MWSAGSDSFRFCRSRPASSRDQEAKASVANIHSHFALRSRTSASTFAFAIRNSPVAARRTEQLEGFPARGLHEGSSRFPVGGPGVQSGTFRFRTPYPLSNDKAELFGSAVHKGVCGQGIAGPVRARLCVPAGPALRQPTASVGTPPAPHRGRGKQSAPLRSPALRPEPRINAKRPAVSRGPSVESSDSVTSELQIRS